MIDEDFVDAEIVYVTITKDILSTIQWRTKERELIYVKDMEDKHIRNSALFLMGMGYTKCRAMETVKIAWLTIFRMEWERRTFQNGIKRFRSYPNSTKELIND